jgi:hypothetical protein
MMQLCCWSTLAGCNILSEKVVEKCSVCVVCLLQHWCRDGAQVMRVCTSNSSDVKKELLLRTLCLLLLSEEDAKIQGKWVLNLPTNGSEVITVQIFSSWVIK